jgi:Phosphoribosyltransferase
VKNLPGNAPLLGEIGIGNTSVASILLARLADLDIEVCTGAGTGLDAPAVQRKAAVLREVLTLHAGATAPLDALAALGGFETATMVGAVLQAVYEKRVVLVDGFIATSAVLVAHALQRRQSACSAHHERLTRGGVRGNCHCAGAAGEGVYAGVTGVAQHHAAMRRAVCCACGVAHLALARHSPAAPCGQ